MGIVKVSVLVPVYKVERYLQRCIDSVISQDFEDWEMILVNDGSPDACPEICDAASLRDSRIVVVHKLNGGLPSARLVAFEHARGEFIVFLDSDDWLLPGALKFMCRKMSEGYDVVKTRPLRHNGVVSWQENYSMIEGELKTSKLYAEHTMLGVIHPYLHSGIYKKTLFSKDVFNNIIKENITIGEDWFANMLICDKVSSVAVVNYSSHAYFVNNSSIMGTSIYSPDVDGKIERLLAIKCMSVSRKTYDALQVKIAINRIRYFFQPEIGFHDDLYQKVMAVYNSNMCLVNNNIDKKFVRFISCKNIYRLYTVLYRFFFFVIKLKCHKRNLK